MGILADVGRSTAGQTSQSIFGDIMKYKQMENQDARDVRAEAAQAQTMDVQRRQLAIQEAEAGRKASEYNDAHTVMSLNDDRVNAEKRGHGAAFRVLEEVLGPAVYTDPNGNPVYLKKDRQAAQAQLMKDPHLKFKMNNALLEGLQAKYDDAQGRVESYEKWKESNPGATLEESQAKGAKAKAALEEMTALKGDLNKQRTITYMSDPEFVKIKLQHDNKPTVFKPGDIVTQADGSFMQMPQKPEAQWVDENRVIDGKKIEGQRNIGTNEWRQRAQGQNININTNGLTTDEQDALSRAIDNGLDPYKVNSRTAKIYAQQEMKTPGRKWNELGATASFERNAGVMNTKALLNTIDPLLNKLDEAGAILGNSSFPGYNKAVNYLKEQTGDPSIVGFKNLRDDVVAEVERGLLGTGVLSDSKYNRAIRNVNESQSYEQLRAATKNIRIVIKARLEALAAGPGTKKEQSPTAPSTSGGTGNWVFQNGQWVQGK